jgi:hypothetical protein
MLFHVLNDAKLNGYIKTKAGSNWEDCRAELCLIISEKTTKELKKIEPYFRFWCVTTVRNMNGTRGIMAKYRRKITKVEPTNTVEEKEEYERLILSTEAEIEGLHWYDRGVLLSYIDEGNMRALSTKTHIPLSSIHATIKKVREHIRKKCRRSE